MAGIWRAMVPHHLDFIKNGGQPHGSPLFFQNPKTELENIFSIWSSLKVLYRF